MTAQNAAPVSPIDRLVATAACQELMYEYGRRMDHGRATTVTELFTPDGEWISPRIHCTGTEQMRTFFQRRDDLVDRITRHVVVNISIRIESSDRATARSVAVEFRGDRGAEGIAELTMPGLVGDYQDVFLRVDGVWRFRRRNVVIDFQRTGEVFMLPPTAR